MDVPIVQTYQLLSCGSNSGGQLGVGHLEDEHTLTSSRCILHQRGATCPFPPPGKKVVALSSGANHTVALLAILGSELKEPYELWASGDGRKGQLGERTLRASNGMPSSLEGYFHRLDLEKDLLLRNLVTDRIEDWRPQLIACGWEVTYVALRHSSGERDDILLSLGIDSAFGELGVEQSTASSPRFPVHLIDLSLSVAPWGPLRILHLTAGPRHAVCALSRNGSFTDSQILLGWGAARHGQVGAVPSAPRIASKPVNALIANRPQLARNWAELGRCGQRVTVGRDHTAVLEYEYNAAALPHLTLHTFGSDRRGQCSSVPSHFDQHRLHDVRCTWNGTHVLTSDDSHETGWSVWSCGSLDRGQRGAARTDSIARWSRLDLAPLLDGHRAPPELQSGSEHVLLRTTSSTSHPSGQVWGWGWNEHGNLSTGDIEDQHTPTRLWPTSRSPPVLSEVATNIWAGCGTSFIQVRQDTLLHTDNQLDFCSRLPKLELHAHLSGSIRRSTLRDLALDAGLNDKEAHIVSGDARTLPEMFAVFGVIHRAVRGAEAIRRIAREILEDFEADGVLYAEIRTTPRAQPVEGLDGEGYVSAVLSGFADYTGAAQTRITRTEARLILSIDRKDPMSLGQQTVDLALKFKSRGVVGIDLSGDPSAGDWTMWEALLSYARSRGLKIALHAGEMAERDDEMSSMLAFGPDRFGHVCFISPGNLDRLRASSIPVELCLTSNVLSNSVPSYGAHHFGTHYKPTASSSEQSRQYSVDRNPVILCTDDSAVFGSPLSREYAIAMQTFGLDATALRELAFEAISASFLNESARETLRQRMLDVHLAEQTAPTPPMT